MVQTGKHATGLLHLKTALEVDPSQGQYWLSYADALLASGQAMEALIVIQTAMQSGLDTPAAHILLQQAETAVRDNPATGMPEVSDRIAQPQTKTGETSLAELLRAGKTAAKKGKPAKNGKPYSKSASPPRSLSQAERNQLITLFNAGRHAELESLARLLVERYPDSGFAWKGLGVSLQMQGKNALAALQKATELSPDDADAHNSLSIALKEHGQLDGAVASCRRALKIKPDFAEAHSNLGNALRGLKQFIEATASYRRALEIKPDYAEAHNNLGVTLKDLGQFDSAVASCRRALEIKPDYADAYINLARVLTSQGKMDDAVAFSQNAVDAKPLYSLAHYNLGIALKDKCRLREASESFLKAISLEPGSSASLTAAIKLAILNYLQTDLPRASEMLELGRPILEKLDHSDRPSHAYYQYLDHLLRWWNKNGTIYQNDNIADILYAVGESHVLSIHNLPILNMSKPFRCHGMWIEGCKQWHLGCEAYNQYKYQFESIMQSIPRHATVLMTFGEIDCRPDEGIVEAWQKSQGKKIEDIALATATNYLQYISQIAAKRNHKVIICGIPASSAPLDKLGEEDMARFQQLLTYFNRVLRDNSLALGMDFLDVFTLTNSGNGISNGLWHIDTNHLRPDAIIEAFKKYYLCAGPKTNGDTGHC